MAGHAQSQRRQNFTVPISTYAPGTDQFDLAVNYGGMVHSQYFGGGLD